jgi:hypothetical protein
MNGPQIPSSNSTRRAGNDRCAAILTMLQQFLTIHPDRPGGWPVLTISRDGQRTWRYGGP